MILLPVVEEDSDEGGATTQASPFRKQNAIESNAKAVSNIRFTMVSQQFDVLLCGNGQWASPFCLTC